MLSGLINSIIQILVFSIVPFLWWLITAQKKENFFHWLGLKKIKNSKGFVQTLLLVALAFCVTSIGILALIQGVKMATSVFYGAGIRALPSAIVYAFLTTALSEEILFRGFLLKRIANRWGFTTANIIQAVIFGILHGAMFFPLVGVLKAGIIIAFTGGIGWCMGYVNEKKAGGSIVPSWLIHGIANLFSASMSMFAIF